MYVMYAAIDHTRTLQASDTPSTGSTRSPTGAPVLKLSAFEQLPDVKTRPWPGWRWRAFVQNRPGTKRMNPGDCHHAVSAS